MSNQCTLFAPSLLKNQPWLRTWLSVKVNKHIVKAISFLLVRNQSPEKLQSLPKNKNQENSVCIFTEDFWHTSGAPYSGSPYSDCAYVQFQQTFCSRWQMPPFFPTWSPHLSAQRKSAFHTAQRQDVPLVRSNNLAKISQLQLLDWHISSFLFSQGKRAAYFL